MKTCLLIALAICAVLLPAALATAAPRTPFAVAAVFPPWWSSSRIEAAADALGQVRGRGATDNIVIIYGGGDLVGKARRGGALWLLDPEAAGVCRTE